MKRKVLEPEQFIRLLRMTFKENVKVGNSTGAEQAVLYLLAGVTGLRRRRVAVPDMGQYMPVRGQCLSQSTVQAGEKS